MREREAEKRVGDIKCVRASVRVCVYVRECVKGERKRGFPDV